MDAGTECLGSRALNSSISFSSRAIRSVSFIFPCLWRFQVPTGGEQTQPAVARLCWPRKSGEEANLTGSPLPAILIAEYPHGVYADSITTPALCQHGADKWLGERKQGTDAYLGMVASNWARKLALFADRSRDRYRFSGAAHTIYRCRVGGRGGLLATRRPADPAGVLFQYLKRLPGGQARRRRARA